MIITSAHGPASEPCLISLSNTLATPNVKTIYNFLTVQENIK
jgi:hypothetical protein